MLMPHSITDGDACFAYFNKKWGIPAGISMMTAPGCVLRSHCLAG